MEQEHPYEHGGAQERHDVLNDRPDLGKVGAARSAGGATAAAFIRRGMKVLDADGHLVGLVAAVETDRIALEPTEQGDEHCYVPLSLVDGVDDERVILSSRGDVSFGIAAET